MRRGREPQKGLWSIPGGALRVGETLEEGACREVREETGLEVSVVERIDVVDRIVRDEQGRVEYHYVLTGFLCRRESGQAKPDDDADAVRWFDRDALGGVEMTPGTPVVVEEAFRLRDRLAAFEKQ